MKDYPEMPTLDSAQPALSTAVADIVRRIQKQGDPLLIMQMDAILMMEDEAEILATIEDITRNINWKEE